jgi:hypothetical protein
MKGIKVKLTKRLAIILATAVAALLVAGTALAALAGVFTLSVPSSGSVVQPSVVVPGTGNTSYAITVFEGSDASGAQLNTTASPGVAWGNITTGAAGVTKTFYVRNDGNQTITVTADCSDLPTGVTSVGTAAGPISPGNGATLTVTISASPIAPVGSFGSAFTNFYANPATP